MNYFSNNAIETGGASGSGPIADRKYTLEELLAAVKGPVSISLWMFRLVMML